ncbi:SURF1 family protein [uncultured Zhongshania sp.]|uniref:SURF1 family protein n=1 Tax=uncultured Zhongshania sp. TaxID=1642288 RepID=UPI0025F73AA8|nr:SURF1 family protein [uncultured Zhongshania sp.]
MAIPSLLKKVITIAIGLLIFAGFVFLGNWQLERRAWKLDLMQRVDARAHASPESAPTAEHWQGISRESDEYRRVSVTGNFISDKDTLIVAATELGSGYWVITPFRRSDSSIVLINRGFINQGVQATPPPTGQQDLIGLLRISEPKGSAIRNNDSNANRWYSRDVAAIANMQNLYAAPYFIDAEKSHDTSQAHQQGSQHPVGGLTVINFHNSHMVYAITWFSLALLVIVAAIIVVREERKVPSC